LIEGSLVNHTATDKESAGHTITKNAAQVMEKGDKIDRSIFPAGFASSICSTSP